MLASGIGIYTTKSKQLDDEYLKSVLFLAKSGKIRAIFTDNSIAYGTNLAVSDIIMIDEPIENSESKNNLLDNVNNLSEQSTMIVIEDTDDELDDYMIDETSSKNILSDNDVMIPIASEKEDIKKRDYVKKIYNTNTDTHNSIDNSYSDDMIESIVDKHSMKTIFQMLGRAGRGGNLSYQAKIYTTSPNNNLINKIISYAKGTLDEGTRDEIHNIAHAFEILW